MECAYTRMYDFEHPESVFCGCYDIYPTSQIVVVWNHYRSLRIITNEIILDALDASDQADNPHRESQRLSSQQCFKKLTAEICASVPPFLGFPGGDTGSTSVMMGTLLLWPLYTCAAHDYASPRTRDWVILQCEKIGETMGIRLATSLAKVLMTRGEVTVWDRIDTENWQGTASRETEEDW